MRRIGKKLYNFEKKFLEIQCSLDNHFKYPFTLQKLVFYYFEELKVTFVALQNLLGVLQNGKE